MRTLRPSIALHAHDRLLNAPLSRIAYCHRLLAESLDLSRTIVERVRLIVRASNEIDDFFRQSANPLQPTTRSQDWSAGIDGLTPRQQARAIRQSMLPLLTLRDACFRHVIQPSLRTNGIHLASWHSLSREERRRAAAVYNEQLHDALTPIAVSPGHAVPAVSDSVVAIIVRIREHGVEPPGYALVPLPRRLPNWYEISRSASDCIWLSAYSLIASNMKRLFSGVDIAAVTPVRLLSHADRRSIAHGNRSGLKHTLLCLRSPDRPSIAFITEQLDVRREDTYELGCRLRYDDLTDVLPLLVRDSDKMKSRPPSRHPASDCAAEAAGHVTVDGADRSWHETDPESPNTTTEDSRTNTISAIEDLLVRANRAGEITSLKLALSQRDAAGPLRTAIDQAARNGAHVLLFLADEERDDAAKHKFARQVCNLASAGVDIRSIPCDRCPAPIGLLARRDADRLRCYAFLATDSMSAESNGSRIEIISADGSLVAPLAAWFHQRARNEDASSSTDRQLPTGVVGTAIWNQHEYAEHVIGLLRLETCAAQTGNTAAVVGWLDECTHPAIIAACYEASQAGVSIQLFIRKDCALRPQVPQLSDHIRVYSNTGIENELSGIVWFRNSSVIKADQHRESQQSSSRAGVFLLCSAGWTRETHQPAFHLKLVDTAITAPWIERLREWYAERHKAWKLQPDGVYQKSEIVDSPDILFT